MLNYKILGFEREGINELDLQMCSLLQETLVELNLETNLKWNDSVFQGAIDSKCQQMHLSVQQICKDLSIDGVVIVAGPYLCSRTTISLISMTFHRQHSVQGPWAR